MSDTCIFCKIVRGEVPCYKVAENESALAFLDIHPANPGHTLVIPKRHAENMFEMTAAEWRESSNLLHTLAIAIEKATGAHGLNIKMNNREHGGQDVMHAHIHIVPRFKGDGAVKPLVQKHAYEEGQAESVVRAILAAM